MAKKNSYLLIAILVMLFWDGCKDSDVDNSQQPDGSTDTDTTDTDSDTDSDTDTETDSEEPKNTHCEDLELTVRQWDDSGSLTDAEYDMVVGDLELETLKGTWKLSEEWTGCDSYVFILKNSQLWSSSINNLLTDSPPNVHYFFITIASSTQTEIAQNDAEAMQQEVDKYLSLQTQKVQDEWNQRFHFVTTPGLAAGWLGEISKQYNHVIHMIGIDRFQKARDGGYAGRLSSNGWSEQIDHARYLAYYYNYESNLTEQLSAESAKEDVLVVNVANNEDFQDNIFTIPMGTAEELAKYNHLEIELKANCPGDVGHPVMTECGEWDTVGWVEICSDEKCEDQKMVVYKWITPYSNTGWWVSDISSFLAYFNHGDPVYLNLHCGYAYKYTINLRFKQLDQEVAPQTITPLYSRSSARFDPTYNENYQEVSFTPPAGTSKVVFTGIISGHGSGSDNCAEFCTHQHKLLVNETPFEFEYEMETGSDASIGCARRTIDGVTPNQGGTWVTDRAAWCPGLPVEPTVIDITDAVNLEGSNTARWSSSFQNGFPPGNGGVIDANMYLSFYSDKDLDDIEITEAIPEPADVKLVSATLRDFSVNHDDFDLVGLDNLAKGIILNAVESELVQNADDDWKPVYAWADDSSYSMTGPNFVPFTNGDIFDQWFNDVDGVNYTIQAEMEWTKSTMGTALFDYWSWYPLELDFGWGSESNSNNKDYTIEVVSTFTYQGGEFLRFSAESDLWVFVNHKLALDLGGGIHSFSDRNIDLDKEAEAFGLVIGETYDIHIFAADRNHTPRLTFEIPENI